MSEQPDAVVFVAVFVSLHPVAVEQSTTVEVVDGATEKVVVQSEAVVVSQDSSSSPRDLYVGLWSVPILYHN